MSGRHVFIGILFVFWMALAWHAWSHGDSSMAGIYVLIGCALTGWRLVRARSS